MARYPKDSNPKLTKELISEISSALRSGCYIETAVAYCGISKNSFYRWLRLAKSTKGNTLHKELSHAIELAMAQSEMRDIEVIDKAAQGSPDKLAFDDKGNLLLDSNGDPIILEYGLAPNWKASAWRLERRFPNRWGRNPRIVEDYSPSSIQVEFVESED